MKEIKTFKKNKKKIMQLKIRAIVKCSRQQQTKVREVLWTAVSSGSSSSPALGSRCGRVHLPMQCPAYGKICNSCRGKNHFSNICNKHGKIETIEYGEDTDFFVGHISKSGVDAKRGDLNSQILDTRNDLDVDNYEWFEYVTIGHKCKLRVKLDTGAVCYYFDRRS